ncbi:MAG: C13 family peptidase [Promethearchaeota archaeon]
MPIVLYRTDLYFHGVFSEIWWVFVKFNKKKRKIAILGSILILLFVGLLGTSITTVVALINMDTTDSANPSTSCSWDKDSDGDQVPDWMEIFVYRTCPFKRDTDGDGMWDGYEIACGKNNGGWQDPLVHNDRYAVMIIGGDSPAWNWARYWNQLTFMYDTLIQGYNYKPEDIFVFYADGNPASINNTGNPADIINGSVEAHEDMIDYDALKLTITNFLTNDLKNKVTSDDSLLFWIYDHGGPDVENATITLWNSQALSDHELHDLLVDYDYAQLTFVMGTCYSGGFLDPSLITGTTHASDIDAHRNLNDLSGNVIVMTSQDYRPSTSGTRAGFLYRFYEGITPYDVIQFPIFSFSFSGFFDIDVEIEWITINFTSSGALMRLEAEYNTGIFSGSTADANSNNLISMQEIYNYAEDNNDFNFVNSGGTDDNIPQYYESTPGLGSVTYL